MKVRSTSDSKKGLKDRALASLSTTARMTMQPKDYKNWGELALRWLVSPRNVSLSGGGEIYTLGSQENASGLAGNLTRVATTVGLGMKQFEAMPGFDALKQALPIVLALLYDTKASQGAGNPVSFADFVGSVNDGWIMNLVLGVMYLLFPLKRSPSTSSDRS